MTDPNRLTLSDEDCDVLVDSLILPRKRTMSRHGLRVIVRAAWSRGLQRAAEIARGAAPTDINICTDYGRGRCDAAAAIDREREGADNV